MTEGLKRYYGKKDLHFVTLSCYQRLPLLDTIQARDLVVEELARVRLEYQFWLVGYVVMPNHVHVLISEPTQGTPSTALQMLEQRVSRKIRRADGKQESTVGHISSALRKLPGFWQARFYDFNVYSYEKKNEKLEYMHANPVISELVRHPGDWSWSSFSFYATGKQGLVPIDPVNF